MTTEAVSLPIVAGGVGAGVDTGALAAEKTLIASGVTGPVDIQIQGAGGVWCTVATFQPGGKTKLPFNAVTAQMRTDASDGGDAATILVAAERTASRFAEIPAGSPGAPVDVSEFGSINTMVLTSGFLEASEDGVNFTQCSKTYNQLGCETKEFSAISVRANGDAVQLGAQENAEAALSEPRVTVVFRPGATGDDAPGGNVYTEWADAYAAIEALRGFGRIFLEVDSQFSSTVVDYTPVGGGITASAQIPAGVWDMTEVVLTNPMTISPGTTIDLLDGCVLDNLQYIEPRNLNINYDGTTPGAIRTAFLDILDEFGRFTNTLVTAAPMFTAADFGLTLIWVMGSPAFFIGFREAANGSLSIAAPLIDVAGGFVQFGLYGGGQLADEAVTDSVGGGFLRIRSRSQASLQASLLQFPLVPDTTFIQHLSESTDTAKIATGSPPTFDPYNYIVKASAGPIDLASALNFSGGRVHVKDWSFDAGSTPIDVTAPAGQTIDRVVKIDYDNGTGPGVPFVIGETLTFGNGSTGVLLTDTNAAVGTMTVRMTDGDAVPEDNDTIAGAAATADVNGSPGGFDQLTTDGECKEYRTDAVGNWVSC